MSRKQEKSRAKAFLVTLSAAVFQFAGASRAAAQSVSCIQPLVFGSVITCNAANTVTVTPSGTRSLSGCLTSGGGPFSHGRCLVFGTFPPVPIVISVTGAPLAGPGPNMGVNNFNLVTNAGGAATTITAFSADITIGATLSIGNPQTSGLYSGAYTLNANY